MKRALRITVRVLGVIVLLFIAAWIFVWAYITYNKAGIIAKVKAGINKQVKGKVEISDVSIDFFHNYPNISVRLSGVTIRDSLWENHHHDFLKAEKIYVRMKFFSLFSGKPDIGKLIIENAQVYYYTDTSGNSNLVTADRKAEKSKGNAIPDMLFKNTRFIMDYPGHNKYHDVELRELECHAVTGDSGTLLKINMNAIVHSLGFNMQKGSYLKEKTMKGDFDLQITKTKEIRFDRAMLNIDKQYFLLSGRFITASEQPSFSLDIQTEKIDFRKAIALLTETTQKKFSSFDIIDPVDISAHLTGPLAYRSIPFAY